MLWETASMIGSAAALGKTLHDSPDATSRALRNQLAALFAFARSEPATGTLDVHQTVEMSGNPDLPIQGRFVLGPASRVVEEAAEVLTSKEFVAGFGFHDNETYQRHLPRFVEWIRGFLQVTGAEHRPAMLLSYPVYLTFRKELKKLGVQRRDRVKSVKTYPRQWLKDVRFSFDGLRGEPNLHVQMGSRRNPLLLFEYPRISKREDTWPVFLSRVRGGKASEGNFLSAFESGFGFALPGTDRELGQGYWHRNKPHRLTLDARGEIIAANHPVLDVVLFLPDGSEQDGTCYFVHIPLTFGGMVIDVNATKRDAVQNLRLSRTIRRSIAGLLVRKGFLREDEHAGC